MVDQRILFTVHWLHVLFGTYWIGSVFFTRTQLFPSLRSLGPDHDSSVRTALVVKRNRRINIAVAVGTVSLGFLRAFLARAFESADTAYRLTLWAAAALGIAMVLFLVAPGGRPPLLRNLYVAAFPVILTLMVLMRFGW